MKKHLFAVLFGVFISPLFATGIDSGAASADCDSATLGQTSGTANLEMDWQPNTINIRWYDGENQLSVPTNAQTCSYDGALYLPTAPTKKGYTFEGWEVRIPAEYTELKYLENNGISYINTRVPGDNNNYDIITDFMVLDLPQTVTWQQVFSNYVDEEHNLWRLLIHKGGTVYLYMNTRSNSAAWYSSSPISLNQRYLIEFNRSKIKINDTIYTNINLTKGKTNDTTIILFSPHSTYPKIRVYSFVIKYNARILFNGIPARRNSDNIVGMYDTITKTFFTNAGTGEFIAGPVVP